MSGILVNATLGNWDKKNPILTKKGYPAVGIALLLNSINYIKGNFNREIAGISLLTYLISFWGGTYSKNE